MHKVISAALDEVGYLEKSSNANLDNKTDNAGSSNYTKYARDLDAISGWYNGKKLGQAWCAVFVDWLFVTVYGADAAKKMTYHNQLGARCDYAANAYRNAGRWYSTPEAGDEIFFKSASYAHAHTGIVVEVTASEVITVEGNTSGASGVISNGGGVCKKAYPINYPNIIGYGRPDYTQTKEEAKLPKLNRPPRVYLSPAYHWFNNCSIAGCDETTHNNLYLDEVEPFLDACGIEWKRGPRRVPKSNENGTDLMIAAVKESDAFGADLHYVSHTNASVDDVEDIGKGKANGCRPIIYKGSARGEDLATYMVARRKAVYPGKVTLNRRSDLYELRVPKAVSFYEEHVFHDNTEDAEWFHAHMKDVARSAVQGMCDYFEIPFVEPEEKPKQSDTMYRVQVGAFRNKDNAEAYLKKVKAAGFTDAYIAVGK